MFYINSKYIAFTLAFFSLLFSCSNTKSNASIESIEVPSTSISMPSDYFGYNFDEPNDKFKLSKKLKEISGLCSYKDKWLAAVQDEKGAIYLINADNGEIEDVIEFSADGDYEGITIVDKVFYVLRADGVLFKITNWEKAEKDIVTTVINTNLGEINDTEGLTYDPTKKRLLIACKGSATIGEDEQHFRAIYAYDLKKSKFKVKPLFTLERKPFKAFIKNHVEENPAYLAYKKEIKKAKKQMLLEPSALAIHPITNDIYLLSAAGNSLLVLDRSYRIKHLKRLTKDHFEQPEGLTFNSKGDLFLSSEGLKKKARIYRFNYQP